MAEERKGHLYEIVTGAALLRAFPGCRIDTQVVLSGSTIRSDWIISRDGEVESLVLVTHSGAETKNTQKFWRDVAEVLQALRSTNGNLRVIAVIFDDNVLEQLITAEAAIVNHLVRCPEFAGCRTLISIPDSKLKGRRLDKNNDWDTTRAGLPLDVALASDQAIETLCKVFRRLAKEKLSPSQLAKSLCAAPEPAEHLCEPSLFYQGCALLMLVRPAERLAVLREAQKNRLPADVSPLLKRLGGAEAIGGARPSAPLRWVAEQMDAEVLTTALAKHEAEKADIYRAMLRASSLTDRLVQALMSTKFRHPSSYLALLRDGFTKPRELAVHLLGTELDGDISFNWPWTFLVTMVREVNGKKQSFGASEIARVTGNRRLCVQNSLVSAFECCERPLDDDDLEALAKYFYEALSGRLGELRGPSLEARMVHEVYVDKLGPHAVHPIPALVMEVAERKGRALQHEWRRTSFGIMAGSTGTAASVRVLANKDVIVWWRSAHDGNEAHKSKEVGARIFGMTTAWDASKRQILRPGAQRKFIMIIDGEFEREHVKFFYAAGADAILRPQEILSELPVIAGW